MALFIPFVLVAASAAAAGVGAKKGYQGVTSIQRAREIGQAAQARYDDAMGLLEVARASVNAEADAFGMFKLEVARDTLGEMVYLLNELQRRGRISSFDTLAGVDFPAYRLVTTMKELSTTATSVLGGVVLGALKGSLTTAALYGLAGSVGIASTGAAIGGLSGVAFESATLAWLGGGALTASGYGMVGGMWVLGSVFTAPVVLIVGYTLAAKGEQALTEASRFAGEVDQAVEQMQTMRAAMQQMRARMRELTDVLSDLRERASACLEVLWRLVDQYDEHDRRHSCLLAATITLCRAMADLVQAPVIEQNGAPNPALPNLIATYRRLTP
jgi:hypothetical protein